jgi:pyruvate dehydrogenase E2 component (dihydrolipoamide acetyltransferase)
MASDVLMPRLSDSMEEGTVLKWLVPEGGEVKRGQPLAEIETDKANMTYESDTEGTVIELLASEGDTLPIGEVIARIGDPSERSDGASQGARRSQAADAGDTETEPSSAPTTEAPPPAERVPSPAQTAPPGQSDGRIKASPVARRMARELGVELANVAGSGPGGRIVKSDVESAAQATQPAAQATQEAEPTQAQPQPQPQPVETGAKGEVSVQEPTRMQRTISRRMAESKATAPDFLLNVEIEMDECLSLRERLKAVASPVPSVNDMVVKACGLALRDHQRVNAAYRDGKFELYSRINVGVAVAAQDALVVPTLFDADRKSLGEIARQTRELIGKVRDGSITPPELSSQTFTVSNLGMYGIDSFSAVINPPQAAILAVGAVRQKPVCDSNGRVIARQMMNATLACDHRILYGADGAQFLSQVRETLQSPLKLAL